MNKVQEFLNEMFGEVRCIRKEDNSIWFVAKDIARILEYRDSNELTGKLEEDEKGTETLCTLGGNQKMTTINESGLYNAVLSITKRNINRYNKAREFKKWVTGTVLVAIRKDGAYIQDEEKVPSGEMSEDEFIMKAMNIMQNKIERLKEENKTLVGLTDSFLNGKNCYDVGTFSKIINTKDNHLGRNNLFKWLREKKMLMNNNIPYQNFIDYFKIISVENKFTGRIDNKTLIKPQGIKYIYNKLMKEGMVIDKSFDDVVKELNVEVA